MCGCVSTLLSCSGVQVCGSIGALVHRCALTHGGADALVRGRIGACVHWRIDTWMRGRVGALARHCVSIGTWARGHVGALVYSQRRVHSLVMFGLSDDKL
jgi:hypothetical protein